MGGYLGLNNKKIHARKCTIQELTNNEMKLFLNENHLQGYIPASVNIALIYNNEIVSALTFVKARYNKKIQWELLRLATKINTNISGGIQRLWKHFISTYHPTSIVSYCDLRWFTGKIYSKLGFLKKNTSKPSYWYTNYKIRYHRSAFTKQKCLRLAKAKNPQLDLIGLTEKKLTRDFLDLHRIWDCGQITWIWQ